MAISFVALLVCSAVYCCYVDCAPAGADEDLRTGIMFNQLAIAELTKQQRNFEDIRDQIASMSSSLVSSQSFVLGFLENVSTRMETSSRSIATHLEGSKQLMESVAGIVLMTQGHQHNLTVEMRKAVQASSRTSEEHMAALRNLLLETNSRLDSLETSVKSLQIPAQIPLQIPSASNRTQEEVPKVVVDTDLSESFCPPHFFTSGRECFYVVERRLMWEDARKECQSLRLVSEEVEGKEEEEEQDIEIIAQLPSFRWKRQSSDTRYVTDLAEPEDFSKLVKTLEQFAGTAGDNFWIGGLKEDSTWKWLSQSKIPVTSWLRGYPRSRDQVVLMRKRSPYLSSRTGRQRNPAICEITQRRRTP
ncbi:uncharacterized protein LOC135201285 [Macrobrachium nipponense]|uniref:uncharacterized protein LOC135201285 n=1 Tax=Macrobrachium nipponense TaxID=159736 RepID=UPI0030C825A5